METPNAQISAVVDAIAKKSKYRSIQASLIESLAAEALAKGRKPKEAVKEVAAKLHQIGGAYFTQKIDYAKWLSEMENLPKDLQDPQVKKFCIERMGSHASTQERLPIITEFFQTTLVEIAPVESILDLACGLNPLALAWMATTADVVYHGIDIFQDMTDFLNRFCAYIGINGIFQAGDITQLKFPQKAQVAFLLKTLPCLEQLEKGISPRLLDAIPADFLLISYPIRSLGGRAKGMGKTYENQFETLMEKRNWQVSRFEFKTELAFLVKK